MLRFAGCGGGRSGTFAAHSTPLPDGPSQVSGWQLVMMQLWWRLLRICGEAPKTRLAQHVPPERGGFLSDWHTVFFLLHKTHFFNVVLYESTLMG